MSPSHLASRALRPLRVNRNYFSSPASSRLCSSYLRRARECPRSPPSTSRFPLAGPSRTFASSHASRAAPAERTQGQDSVLLMYPTPTAVNSAEAEEESDEPEVDYVPPEEARLVITERAAEQLRSITERRNNPKAGVRVSVESGGCHGYQYKVTYAEGREPNDYLFSHPSVRPSHIVVDAVSMALMNGATVDFVREIIGSRFLIVDNPQAKGGNCGCGVSWELKI